MGYRDVFALQGGWNAWVAAGFTTEAAAGDD
jgi:3-mercaptopyruvate sulfurtransferase SseA